MGKWLLTLYSYDKAWYPTAAGNTGGSIVKCLHRFLLNTRDASDHTTTWWCGCQHAPIEQRSVSCLMWTTGVQCCPVTFTVGLLIRLRVSAWLNRWSVTQWHIHRGWILGRICQWYRDASYSAGVVFTATKKLLWRLYQETCDLLEYLCCKAGRLRRGEMWSGKWNHFVCNGHFKIVVVHFWNTLTD